MRGRIRLQVSIPRGLRWPSSWVGWAPPQRGCRSSSVPPSTSRRLLFLSLFGRSQLPPETDRHTFLQQSRSALERSTCLQHVPVQNGSRTHSTDISALIIGASLVSDNFNFGEAGSSSQSSDRTRKKHGSGRGDHDEDCLLFVTEDAEVLSWLCQVRMNMAEKLQVLRLVCSSNVSFLVTFSSSDG